MQLTDEPEKRCYPLNGRLLCYYCRIKISPNVSIYSPNTVQPTYYAERGTTEQVSLVSIIENKYIYLFRITHPIR